MGTTWHRENRLRDSARHLPFTLVVFLVLFLGFVDLSLRLDWQVLVTLLAPILWLGLYWLGTNPTEGRG